MNNVSVGGLTVQLFSDSGERETSRRAQRAQSRGGGEAASLGSDPLCL